MEKELLYKKALKSIKQKENTGNNEVESRLNFDDNSDIFTKPVKRMSTGEYLLGVLKNLCIKVASFVWSWIVTIGLAIVNIFVSVYKFVRYGTLAIGRFFKNLGHKFKYNDKWGRLSFVFFGAGSFGHKQYINGILYILFEIGYILFFALVGFDALSGIWNLGSIRVDLNWAATPEASTPKLLIDNALLRLITGLFVLISIFVFFFIWLRSINAGYNNYRISKFNEYKKVHEKLIPLSNEIDSYISNLYKNFYDEKGEQLIKNVEDLSFNTAKAKYFNSKLSLSKGVIKKELKDLLNKYLELCDNKFEKSFAAYSFNETIVNSNLYYKNYYRELNKQEKQEFKYNLTVEMHIAENDAIMNNAELSDEQKDLQISNKLLKDKKIEHKFEDRVNSIKKKISDTSKTHSPFVSKLSRINYNTYAKFNDYFNTISKYNVDLKFFNAYKALNDYYHEIGADYVQENSNNATKKEELTENCALKLQAIEANYASIFAKKQAILDNKQLIINALKDEIKNLRSQNIARSLDENHEYENQVKEKLNELTTVAEIVSKEVDLKNFTLEQIANTLFTERINKLDGQYNSFASDKLLKTLQKEEMRLVSKRAKDDIKYLKTNFTNESYASEETINKMLVEYDFDYGYARKHIQLVKENYSEEYVNEQIDKLEQAKANYISSYESTKFVGKSKTFVQQIKSLFNDKFHVTILTLPILGSVIFCIIPLVFSILIAFTNYDKFHTEAIAPFQWTGFETFIKMFEGTDPVFGAIGEAIGATFLWTFVWAIFATFTNYFLGIIVALMINKDGIKLKKLWRTLFVLTIAIPQFISLSTIAKMLQASGTGVLNNIYQSATGVSLGFAQDFTNNALVTKVIIIVVNVWVGIPYTILSTTGILLNIPKDLYESSRIDGAGPTTQFFKITMPYILFVTGPSLITSFIGNFNNFGVIYFLTGGAPRRTSGSAIAPGYTDLFITYIYTLVTSETNKYYNVASALGIIIFIVCSFISIIMYNKTGAVSKEDQFQ